MVRGGFAAIASVVSLRGGLFGGRAPAIGGGKQEMGLYWVPFSAIGSPISPQTSAKSLASPVVENIREERAGGQAPRRAQPPPVRANAKPGVPSARGHFWRAGKWHWNSFKS